MAAADRDQRDGAKQPAATDGSSRSSPRPAARPLTSGQDAEGGGSEHRSQAAARRRRRRHHRAEPHRHHRRGGRSFCTMRQRRAESPSRRRRPRSARHRLDQRPSLRVMAAASAISTKQRRAEQAEDPGERTRHAMPALAQHDGDVHRVCPGRAWPRPSTSAYLLRDPALSPDQLAARPGLTPPSDQADHAVAAKRPEARLLGVSGGMRPGARDAACDQASRPRPVAGFHARFDQLDGRRQVADTVDDKKRAGASNSRAAPGRAAGAIGLRSAASSASVSPGCCRSAHADGPAPGGHGPPRSRRQCRPA